MFNRYRIHSSAIFSQMPQNFRFTLLKSMGDVTESFLDLPVFCRDGLAFSNKFLLAAASPLIK
jgi:hypothetical protein